MNRIIQGIQQFQKDVFPANRELFTRLASGQKPEALFIACSDSRVSLEWITQCGPGDLFVCRNAGNMVPRFSRGDDVSATIEYAVSALGVRDVVVCGHSDCGAMKALLNPASLAGMPHVKSWLRQANEARQALGKAQLAHPSAETLAWVAASMGRGSRIVGYRRLTGGVCSAVHRLTVARRGKRTFVVLRQYPGGLGLQGSLETEIANLGVVAGSGLPVPSILATDVAGASTGGAPSLLMTRLQGHVHLNPAEPRSWMTRIAEIAVLLHSLDLPAKMFRPWTDSWIAPLDGFQVPVDAQKPAVWKAAFGVMAAPPPKDAAVFLHCDLLPVNMMWSRGRITGLTDWNSIHRGARAIDVGHCRRYLAALYSPEWSEQLRSLYESIAGVTLDPWWDLYALLHYDDSGPKWIRGQVAGRRPVDVPGMTSRVEVAIETALRRLG